VLGKEGVIPHLTEMWGPAGHQFLDETQMGDAYQYRLESLRDLIAVYDIEIRQLDQRIHRQLRDDVGYRTIQQLNGVGPVHAAAFVAEIGDVSRFSHPKRLCSWAGLTPRLRESDTKTYRGGITKQGSTLVRWSAVEAVSRFLFATPDGEHLDYSNWLHPIWYPARKRADVEWAQFHDLRRANATGLVLEGIDLKTAQTRLGHTDPRLTLGIYAQATTESDRQAADRLGERFLPRRDQDRGRGLA